MKTQILALVCVILSHVLVSNCYSQSLDLIVTTKNDSIACRIDSISDESIFYEMKSHNTWIQTQIERVDVTEYKHHAIETKQYKFKPGTSIIDHQKPAVPDSFSDIQRNSIYAGILSFSYSRMVPLKNAGIGVAGGISLFGALFGENPGFMGELSLLSLGTKHFFEPGLLIVTDFNDTFPFFRLGYRYQGPEGFLLRIGFMLGYDDGISGLPTLSLGYSF